MHQADLTPCVENATKKSNSRMDEKSRFAPPASWQTKADPRTSDGKKSETKIIPACGTGVASWGRNYPGVDRYRKAASRVQCEFGRKVGAHTHAKGTTAAW